MLSKVRGAGLSVQLMTAIWAFACGRVDAPSPLTGSGGTGGQGVGGTETTSGGASSGGASAFGTGGQATGTGGLTDPINPGLDECGLPLGAIDPPCAADDVLVPSGCTFGDSVEFEYPATDLTVPTAEGLRMVLLPRADAGLGGASGQPPLPYELPVRMVPESAGTITGNTFSLKSTNSALLGYFPNVDGDMSAYMLEHDQSPDPPIREGQIAIVSGETVLDQHRIVVPPFLVCLIK